MALECVRNKLGEPGADGRRRPIPIEGSEFQIATDSIIVAIGQRPDLLFLSGSRVSLHKNGSIAANPETGLAGAPHIYAGGDVVEGPDSLIAACADGRRAAEAICRELGIVFEQLPARPATLSEKDILQVKRVRARKEAQHKPDMLPPAQRSGFQLIEATLSEQEARSEALRCVQCTTFCDKCVEVCPNRANFTYFVEPPSLQVPRLSCQNGRLVATETEWFRVSQARQIIHIDDLCNECDNCATFCVHDGRPYRDKPRLFLKESDFAREDDNAFYVEGGPAGWSIRRREGGHESRLERAGDELAFENEWLRVSLSPDWQVKSLGLKKEFPGHVSLAKAAEMDAILKGIVASLPFLPFHQGV